MKKFNLIILLSGFLLIIISGNQLFGQQYFEGSNDAKVPSVYLGLGLGINDYGIGVGLEIPLTDKLSINGNAGLGGWGWKIGGNINLYSKQVPYNSEFSLGFSHASGLQGFKQELGVGSNDTKQMVELDLNTVETINLMYTYNLRVGNSCKAAFSAGYAISITNIPYEVKTSGVVLSETSKQIIDIMQPGGLIIGVKFMFGI